MITLSDGYRIFHRGDDQTTHYLLLAENLLFSLTLLLAPCLVNKLSLQDPSLCYFLCLEHSSPSYPRGLVPCLLQRSLFKCQTLLASLKENAHHSILFSYSIFLHRSDHDLALFPCLTAVSLFHCEPLRSRSLSVLFPAMTPLTLHIVDAQ